MIKYNEYIKENIQIKLDRKHGFFMFLKVIDEMKMNFIKTNHYLNVGKYQYFFTTEHIKNKDNFIRLFRDLLSIKVTCETANNIKDQRISFYFGVKDGNLEYGFHDDMKREIYKTGVFQIDNRYLRSLRSYKCLVLIEGILKTSNILSLSLLQEVKYHMKYWYEGMGDVIILNENVLSKTINREEIEGDSKDNVLLLKKYEKWCEKFKWYDKVYFYIDNDDENTVTFFIKVKGKREKIN